jgi:hypothetical protein
MIVAQRIKETLRKEEELRKDAAPLPTLVPPPSVIQTTQVNCSHFHPGWSLCT